MKTLRLTAHPAFPPKGIAAVEVVADLRRGTSVLTYQVMGETLRTQGLATAERTDGLWQRTCFELFVRPAGGEAYFEFNFAPSTQWAAYQLTGYRAGMTDQPLAPPMIETAPDGVRVAIDLGGLPDLPWQVEVSAVIEEIDGTKSYWSLTHPADKPDFHHPDCFVVEVAAPTLP